MKLKQNNGFGQVAVLMGGISAEREVSLKSGLAITQALKAEGISASACDVKSITDLIEVSKKYDRAFIALHGRWGEDGTVQGVLESLNFPFTGSKMAASALAMDKLRTKWLWQGAGLATPKFIRVDNSLPFNERDFSLGFPVIVKPIHEGSSIGMAKAGDMKALKSAIIIAQQYDSEILIEQWITGREFTCAILNSKALPLIELKTTHEFYDYDAKYKSNDTQYICPVDLTAKQQEIIQTQALQAFDVVGAETWGRVDFMLDENDQAWLIELNSTPGMTHQSLVPMAAQASGSSFNNLVVKILKSTL